MTEPIFILLNGERMQATGEMLDQILLDRQQADDYQAAVEAEQLSRKQARESAVAKLAALGLTDAEIAALLGG